MGGTTPRRSGPGGGGLTNCLFFLHLRMKIVLIELYIILVCEEFYFFIYLIIHGSKSSFV